MKVISKEHFQGLSYEAKVLCSLRHPGIPILYDYGEDEERICLIEEYIRGVSLEEYLLYHSNISRDWVRQIMTQLCDILSYLHEQPNPILYQDLKPEHVMIRGDQVILIDYGIAYPKGQTRYGAGTPKHSAPEQFQQNAVDERSDIYGLGKIAKLLCDHQKERPSAREIAVIQWALQEDVAKRPTSVKEWKAAFPTVVPEKRKNEKYLPQEIAIVGARRGVGTTHVAIALTTYLNQKHRKAFFVNRTEDAVLQRILQNRGEFQEKDGIIYHNHFAGILDYGPAVSVTTPPDGIRVVDCGTDWDKARVSDFILYVCTSRPWKEMDLDMEKAMNPRCYVLMNPGSKGVGREIAKGLKKKVFGFPTDENPFFVTKEKEKLWNCIWEREERHEKTFESF